MRGELEARLSRIARVVDLDGMTGPRAVVLCTSEGIAEASERIAARAPAAVVAVAVEDDASTCQAVYEGTLFPASRIVGCSPAAETMVEAVSRIVEAALLGVPSELDCTVMRNGRFERHRAELGQRGVARVLD